MRILVACAGGMIGGLIGAAAWAGITYATGYEIGWIAWGVGFIVGLGVRMGAGDTLHGVAPGLLATVIAVLAILGGKYAAVSLIFDKHLGNVKIAQSDEGHITSYAYEIIEERQAGGKELAWPAGKNLENAQAPADFPPEVWQAATQKWKDLGDAGQQRERDAQHQLTRNLVEGLKWQAFKSSFSLMDLIFFVLAIGTAFKLGAAVDSEGSA